MSSETVRIVSSGSCLVRELWRVARQRAAAYWALTVHSKNADVTSFPVPVPYTGRAMLEHVA